MLFIDNLYRNHKILEKKLEIKYIMSIDFNP